MLLIGTKGNKKDLDTFFYLCLCDQIVRLLPATNSRPCNTFCHFRPAKFEFVLTRFL